MLELNETNSKIPRVPSADISKQLGRYNAVVYKREKFQPDYNPNPEVGKRRWLCGPKFEKIIPRSGFEKRPATANENHFDHSHYYRNPEQSSRLAK